jgi:hypothetical protein
MLNQYVQNLIARDKIMEWFLSLNENDKSLVVKEL